MALAKNVVQNRKNQKQLKKGKKIVQKQEEETEEEEDNDSKIEEAEESIDMENEDDYENEVDDDENEDDDDENEYDDNDSDNLSPNNKQKERANGNPGEHTIETHRERNARLLCLGNLPKGTTKEDLKELSSDIVEIFLKSTKNCAFIRFNDEETAVSNFNVLKSKTMKGQSLTVDFCGIKSTSNKNLRYEENAKKLCLKNLPKDVTEEDLKKLSSDIAEVDLPGTKMFAYIKFNDEETAVSNFNVLKSKSIKGQSINVEFCNSKINYKMLFVKNLPQDITEDDFKSLSKDIIEIDISQGPKKFAFLTFKSRAKAESNYEILKDQEIRGQKICVEKPFSRGEGYMKQITVSGLPLDVTIEQVASYFQKAVQITLNRSELNRTAKISFDTEEDAKEAENAAKDIEIVSERRLSVRLEGKRKWVVNYGHFGFGRGGYQGKKMKSGEEDEI